VNGEGSAKEWRLKWTLFSVLSTFARFRLDSFIIFFIAFLCWKSVRIKKHSAFELLDAAWTMDNTTLFFGLRVVFIKQMKELTASTKVCG
jgi:hypothetical protein